LIYDNVEEDVPVAHDILKSWLPDFTSALMIRDSDAGFRTFMGADRTSAESIEQTCQESIHFSGSFVQSQSIQQFETRLAYAITQHQTLQTSVQNDNTAFSIHPFRFYPQALDWITSEIDHLIQVEKVPAQEIVVLTPFLSDSLRFSIGERFSARNLPFSTFRPSRSLQDEPAVKAMLTFAKLAHPGWGLLPSCVIH
jgi:superfamily I DNA/RNA helicase